MSEVLIQRIRERLDPVGRVPGLPAMGDAVISGDHLDPPQDLVPAAVLVPLLWQGSEPHLLFTERAAHLKKHAGQISFPGGRIEPNGESPAEAAVRELEEETGIASSHVELLGQSDVYQTGTGFSVTPIVARLHDGYDLTPDPGEVADVFTAPFAFFMDPRNHRKESAMWKGRMRHFYAMPWQDRNVWGATAGMIKVLHQRLYERVG